MTDKTPEPGDKHQLERASPEVAFQPAVRDVAPGRRPTLHLNVRTDAAAPASTSKSTSQLLTGTRA